MGAVPREKLSSTRPCETATKCGRYELRYGGHLPRSVVGSFRLNPLPHKHFATSCIDFEVVLGIEWALKALFLRKNATFET
jgi:hypothetical protein